MILCFICRQDDSKIKVCTIWITGYTKWGTKWHCFESESNEKLLLASILSLCPLQYLHHHCLTQKQGWLRQQNISSLNHCIYMCSVKKKNMQCFILCWLLTGWEAAFHAVWITPFCHAILFSAKQQMSNWRPTAQRNPCEFRMDFIKDVNVILKVRGISVKMIHLLQ